MEDDVTARLSKLNVDRAEAAAALASALTYAVSGTRLLPNVIRTQGEKGIPIVEAYQTMMAESIIDVMLTIGLSREEVDAHVVACLNNIDAIAMKIGQATMDDAYQCAEEILSKHRSE